MKLTKEIIDQIPLLYITLGTQKKVAESLGISTSSVSKYLKLNRETSPKENIIKWDFSFNSINSIDEFLVKCNSPIVETKANFRYVIDENEDYFFLSVDGDINLGGGSFLAIIPYILGITEKDWENFLIANNVKYTTPNFAPKFQEKKNALKLCEILNKNIKVGVA